MGPPCQTTKTILLGSEYGSGFRDGRFFRPARERLLTACWGLDPLAHNFKESVMSLGTILLIVLILALVGVLPTWPHSSSWGYGPVGGVGLLVIVVIVLLVMGRL
jgi:hypothetical protein